VNELVKLCHINCRLRHTVVKLFSVYIRKETLKTLKKLKREQLNWLLSKNCYTEKNFWSYVSLH